MKDNIPNRLFHAASAKYRELKPGFLHSKELVKWDGTESNEFLYATSDRAEAINQGFAGSVEKKYKIDRYRSHDGQIEITFSTGQKLPDVKDLADLTVWLYSIPTSAKQSWVKVNNKHNGLDTEFKTREILDDFNAEQIDVPAWLKGKNVKLIGG